MCPFYERMQPIGGPIGLLQTFSEKPGKFGSLVKKNTVGILNWKNTYKISKWLELKIRHLSICIYYLEFSYKCAPTLKLYENWKV